MTRFTGVERRRTAGRRVFGVVFAGLATAAVVKVGAAQCVPSWDPDLVQIGAKFGSGVGSVNAMASFGSGAGSRLYVGGSFTTFEDMDTPTPLAWWDGQAWSVNSTGGTDGYIETLTVFDDGTGPALYAGGPFTTMGGVAAINVARYDHVSNTWHAVGEGVNFNDLLGVRKLIEFQGHLYAIGSATNDFFNYAGIARWDGSEWTHLAVPPLSGATVLGGANDAVVLDNQLYIAGSHASSGGRVVRLNGTSLEVVGSAIGSNVLSLTAFQDTLYAGTFCAPGGVDIGNCVHEWDGGTSWSGAFGAQPFMISRPSPGPAVRGLHVADDGSGGGPALIAVGFFRNASPTATLVNVAKFDGTEWHRLPFGVFTSIDTGGATVVYDHNDGTGNGVYVGGSFSAAHTEGHSGFPSRGIARWGCFDQIPPPPVVDPYTSELLASHTIISGYGGQADVTVVPRDSDGQLLPAGREVAIQATGGNPLGSVQDLGDGTYRQTLEGNANQAGATITASVDGVEITASVFITFVAVDPITSTIALDADQVLVGTSALVTVVPADDQGEPVGPGLSVTIYTTHGEPIDSISDNGDGTYTQLIVADEVGTASITASVNGLVLDTSASLSFLDIAGFGDIVGISADGAIIAFVSIQEAIDSGAVSNIFIVPGTYEETLQIEGRSGVSLIGLSDAANVIVRGLVVSDSSDITIQSLTIDASSGPHDAVRLRGGPRASNGITIRDSTIHAAVKAGIFIDRGNGTVIIEDTVITGNGRNGIEAHLEATGIIVRNCVITSNGYNGVSIGRDVEILLEHNVISGNGVAAGQGGGRWGIDRQRKPQGGTPEQVTLIQNVIENNNGRPKQGSVDANINNYDQIIDATDDQPPYTE